MQTLKELTYIDIPLRRDHLNDKALYRLMGYGNRVPDNAVLEIIESQTIKLMQACKARAGYRIVECKHNDSSNIVCDGTIFHTGNIIASAMERATMLAIFTVTLGKAYKEWMEEIRGEADIVREFVGDSIASVFAGKDPAEVYAKEHQAFVMLVAHPKKDDDNFSPDSILGSSNITNLCDIILRYAEPKSDSTIDAPRILQVWKNRLDGRVNHEGIPLYYQDSSKRLSESKNFDWEFGWENAKEFEEADESTPFDGDDFEIPDIEFEDISDG